MYELHLCFPPTVNNYYVKTQRGVFISQKGRKFRAEVAEQVAMQLPNVHLTGRLLVEVVLYPPDKRRRDVDNYSKALLDAITHTGLWEDDSQIDQLMIYRGARHPGGAVFMRIGDAGPVLPFGTHPPTD
jgi:crossover junction endodeoxyribonuclease RusA